MVSASRRGLFAVCRNEWRRFVNGSMRHSTRDYSVFELVDLVQRGALALPDFQRGFVWDSSQVAELLDSVASGWPIGSLLLLEGPQPFGVESISGAPTSTKDRVHLYLLDGQQRVTALFHALTDTSDHIYYVNLEAIEPEAELEIKTVPRRRFDALARRFDVIKLVDLIEPNSDAVAQLPVSRRIQIRDLIRDRMPGFADNSYRIPAIVMGNDIELEALTRIFETLNRTGEKLDAFDLMVAVLRPSGFLLRDRWNDAKIDYPKIDALNVDGVEILKLIALRQRLIDKFDLTRPRNRRVLGIRQRDVLNIPALSIQTNWFSAVQNYSDALDFLSSFVGVEDADSVPSWAMILTLAVLLDRGLDRRSIERWYWSSVLSQAYAQGANTQVLTDVDDEELPNRAFDLRDGLASLLKEPMRRNRIGRYALRGALRRSGALDAITGEPLRTPLAEISISRASNGDFRPSLEDSLFDVALCGRSSLRFKAISPAGLESQGFNTLLGRTESELANRVDTFSRLIGSWI
jgi:Protein of unknown function DUF262